MRFASPSRVARRSGLVIWAIGLFGCGGSSSTSPTAATPVTTAFGAADTNVLPIVVNPGPAGDYANGLFTTVTICVSGTTNCQTIGGVLVDTGSSGLRLLSSVVTLKLPQVQDSNGSPLATCTQFVDSYQWGPIVRADVKLGGETAPAIPIHLVGDPAFAKAPSDCSNSGLPTEDTVALLGATGVLGVGLWREDCGSACARTGSSNPGSYYACPASGCQTAAVPLELQAQNPVWHFPTDNNGLAIQLPAVPSTGAVSVNGSMVFGIGTRANNSLGTASVYTVDGIGNFTTIFQNRSYPESFIDSGSNGIFFLDTATAGIATCRGSTDFYCPVTPLSLQATNRGQNGTSGTVSFNVASADALFNSPNYAFGNLAGPNAGAFDWGLSFFFGKVVFTAIEQQTTPSGTGPYFAY
jgi:hypothetical protein